MAAAIPAAIGAGSSIFSAFSGKNAQNKAEKLTREQMALIQPLLRSQVDATTLASAFGEQMLPWAMKWLDQSRNEADTAAGAAYGDRDTAMMDYKKLLNDALAQRDSLYTQGQGLATTGKNMLDASSPYLRGAGSALSDLQRFYRPFMDGGQRAIDRFLPSGKRTLEAAATDIGQVNQGYRSASQNIAEFAPRGPGRITAGADLERSRQQGISDTFFKTRQGLQDKSLTAAFQGAQGQQGVAQALQALGVNQGQLGLSTIGQGLNTIGAGTQALGTGGGLAQGAFGQGQQSLSQVLQALTNKLQTGQAMGSLGASLLGVGTSGGTGALDLYNQTANRAASSGGNSAAEGLGASLQRLFSNPAVQNKIGGIFGGGTTKTIPGTDFDIGMNW